MRGAGLETQQKAASTSRWERVGEAPQRATGYTSVYRAAAPPAAHSGWGRCGVGRRLSCVPPPHPARPLWSCAVCWQTLAPWHPGVALGRCPGSVPHYIHSGPTHGCGGQLSGSLLAWLRSGLSAPCPGRGLRLCSPHPRPAKFSGWLLPSSPRGWPFSVLAFPFVPSVTSSCHRDALPSPGPPLGSGCRVAEPEETPPPGSILLVLLSAWDLPGSLARTPAPALRASHCSLPPSLPPHSLPGALPRVGACPSLGSRCAGALRCRDSPLWQLRGCWCTRPEAWDLGGEGRSVAPACCDTLVPASPKVKGSWSAGIPTLTCHKPVTRSVLRVLGKFKVPLGGEPGREPWMPGRCQGQ